ncbi:MAG: PilZ domain-containing protein [Deltaproteobacteria bacterium]|nr:PilZ domain-containing protein [Deltaproteobacteria bacterium]
MNSQDPFTAPQEQQDRRASRRAAYDAAVSCEFYGQSVLDYTANLSAGGVYIRTNKMNAPLGAPVKITLRVPGMTQRTALTGWVVRIDVAEDSVGVAIRFAPLSDEVRAAIDALAAHK